MESDDDFASFNPERIRMKIFTAFAIWMMIFIITSLLNPRLCADENVGPVAWTYNGELRRPFWLVDTAEGESVLFIKYLTTLAPLPEAPFAVRLWPENAPNGDKTFEMSEAKVTVHLPQHPGGSAIVICPGGGYGGLVTGPEGHGIAEWLNTHGIAGIVLEYRLPAGRAFVPLLDAQRAIRTVRARATEWQINPAQVGIMGFSAGGHLASTAATHFDAGNSAAADPLDRPHSRPDFAVLVYPVVTMGEKTHGGSRTNLLGAMPSQELMDLFSGEKQVTDKSPPMFLAHAVDDGPVPSHSKALFESLQAAMIPSKYLELPSGGHGLDGYQGPMWDAWQKQSLEWLAEQQLIRVLDAGNGRSPRL